MRISTFFAILCALLGTVAIVSGIVGLTRVGPTFDQVEEAVASVSAGAAEQREALAIAGQEYAAVVAMIRPLADAVHATPGVLRRSADVLDGLKLAGDETAESLRSLATNFDSFARNLGPLLDREERLVETADQLRETANATEQSVQSIPELTVEMGNAADAVAALAEATYALADALQPADALIGASDDQLAGIEALADTDDVPRFAARSLRLVSLFVLFVGLSLYVQAGMLLWLRRTLTSEAG